MRTANIWKGRARYLRTTIVPLRERRGSDYRRDNRSSRDSFYIAIVFLLLKRLRRSGTKIIES